MPSESIISCANIFFIIRISKLMSTKTVIKKGLPVLCTVELYNFEFWLRQGEGGTFLRRDSFEGRCKFKYFLNRSSLITEK